MADKPTLVRQGDTSDKSDQQFFLPTELTQVATGQLPIRGEKRIIPKPVSPDDFIMPDTGESVKDMRDVAAGVPNLPSDKDFYISAAKKQFTDYVVVRLPHRGTTVNDSAFFRFLINPKTCRVNKQTLDSQAITRGGWQFGIWGENTTRISLSGTTPGQYYTRGLTDSYAEFSISYRNLTQLQTVFENNGYWFEGEEAGSGPLAADFTRRRIKMHQSVELTVGNFIWHGMFESMQISRGSDSPFTSQFTLEFVAWIENYKAGSPYKSPIPNGVERGHSYDAYKNYGKNTTDLFNATGGAAANPQGKPLTDPLRTQNPAVVADDALKTPLADFRGFDQVPDHVLGAGNLLDEYWNGNK